MRMSGKNRPLLPLPAGRGTGQTVRENENEDAGQEWGLLSMCGGCAGTVREDPRGNG